MRVVSRWAPIEHRLSTFVVDSWRRRREGEHGHRRRIDARVLCEIRERDTVEGVVGIVLFGVVLTRFAETDRGETLEVPRRVIAPTAEAIPPRHQPHAMRWHVARGSATHERRERA